MSTNEAKLSNAPKADDGRLPIWRRVCYGMVDAGGNFSFGMISSYLTVFYTDVVGLTPAIISIIMAIARVWDCINDPMMGTIADKTHSRWGKYRPYLLFGAPILGVCTVLAFTKPTFTGPMSFVYCGITYILAGMAYTATGVAGQALANVLSRNNQERMVLISFRSALSQIATFITGAATMPLLLHFGNGNASSAKGYTFTVLIYAILGTICYWITFAGTKEVVTPPAGAPQMKMLEGLKISFGDPNVRKLLIGYLAYMSGIFFRIGVMVYFFLYVVENPIWMSLAATVMTVAMAVPSLVAPFLTKRIEKKTIMVACLILAAVGGGLIFLGGSMVNLPLILVGTAMFHGLGSLVGNISFGMVGEIVDDMEVRTGKRCDAIVLSVCSFAVKLGNAIAGTVGILLLGAVGYVANAVQTAGTKVAMNVVINLIPAGLLLVAIIPFLMLSINRKKVAENSAILAERNKSSEAE